MTSVLEQRGARAYLPLLRKRKPRAGRRDWEPLFPGYVFASLEIPSDTWLTVRSAPDVAYFLGQPDHPTALPDGFVPALIARLDTGNRTDRPAQFRPGQRVVIAEGPFQWVEAVFDRRLSPTGRSRVLLQLLHRLVPLELPEGHLRNAG